LCRKESGKKRRINVSSANNTKQTKISVSTKTGKVTLGLLKEFRAFILRGNVMDLAIAFILGAAFSAVVSGLVADLITPLIAAIGGNPDFSGLSFTLNGSVFKYGHFLNQLISFLIIAAVIFFLIVRPLNGIIRKHMAEVATRFCPECLSEVPAKAKRCKFCGTASEPAIK
jgi:large conductance mechanosensitive channel